MKNFLFILFFVCACAKNEIPQNFVVKNFEINKYLGTWYEIARIDNKFEKDLINVKANYSLMDNGKVKVINSGYNTKKNEDKSIEGVAYLLEDGIGQLKVSFFRPFYAYYNIILLDENYEYAVVAGGNYDYLWILSKDSKMSNEVYNELINKINDMGFDTKKIVKF